MTRSIHFRLCLMMFLQYLAMGAASPILSLYLKTYLHFSGVQIGYVFMMSAVAAFISPILGSFIADRLMSAHRLLGICHLCASACMFALSLQTDFHGVQVVYLFYAITFGPTIALSNAVAFHNLSDGRDRFGFIRLWGTVGWIVVAWAFSYLWLKADGGAYMAQRLPDALKLSSLASLAMAIYAFTLPSHQSKSKDPVNLFPKESLAILAKPEVLLLAGVCLLYSIVVQFYMFGLGPFMRQAGFSEANIMPSMSLGQFSEIIGMLCLGFFIKRFAVKWIILLGICIDLVRFSCLSIGSPSALILAGISCHGFAFTFFSMTVSIYLDSFCDKKARAGVHQLFGLISSAVGGIGGNLAAGAAMDQTVSSSGSYQYYWMIPGIIAGCYGVIVLFFFKRIKVQNAEVLKNAE